MPDDDSLGWGVIGIQSCAGEPTRRGGGFVLVEDGLTLTEATAMADGLTVETQRPHMVRRPAGYQVEAEIADMSPARKSPPPKKPGRKPNPPRNLEPQAIDHLRACHHDKRMPEYQSTIGAIGATERDLTRARWAELVMLVAEGRAGVSYNTLGD